MDRRGRPKRYAGTVPEIGAEIGAERDRERLIRTPFPSVATIRRGGTSFYWLIPLLVVANAGSASAVNCNPYLGINAYPAVRRTGPPPDYTPNPLYVTKLDQFSYVIHFVSDVNLAHINILRTHDADAEYRNPDYGGYSISNATLPMYHKNDFLEVGDVRARQSNTYPPLTLPPPSPCPLPAVGVEAPSGSTRA